MSRFTFPIQSAVRHLAAALLTCGVLLFGASPAWAGVPGVDFYLGAGIGTGDVAITSPGGAVDQFKENHTAFKVFGGLRVASVLGVELDYLDFGKTSGSLGSDPDVTGKMTGGAAFGLFYLPLPLPVLDIYAKAGLARLDKKISDLDAKERTATGKTKADLQAHLPAIRQQRDDFVRDMVALDRTSPDTWDAAKANLDREWDALEASVDKAY